MKSGIESIVLLELLVETNGIHESRSNREIDFHLFVQIELIAVLSMRNY